MRVPRTLLTGAMALVLLAGLASVAIALEEEAGTWATPVTGQRLSLDADGTAMTYSEGEGYGQGRDYVVTETWRWSDARLPSEMTSVLNFDADVTGEWPGQSIRGRLLLEGADGSWTGTQDALAMTDGSGIGMVLLSGLDSYEGLSAIFVLRTDDPDCVDCLLAEGFVYEGALTPLPE